MRLYLLSGKLTIKNGKVDKYIFDGGYVQASAADFQPYKYNGKELDKMHGLNTYDYGARQHDPILARWDRIDPLCEKYYNVSPYVYCENSPANTFDPDGRSGLKVISKAIPKIGKSVAKNGLKALSTAETYATAFTDIKESFNTITDDKASTSDKLKAGISIASELLPVSVGDVKQIKNIAKKTYQTYIKTHPITGKKYIGRTSGKGTPLENIAKRDRNHHKTKEGYGPAVLDKSSSNPDAIRGQEQYQIDKYGGAQSQGGTSGNAINEVSSHNPKKEQYEQARRKEFGE